MRDEGKIASKTKSPASAVYNTRLSKGKMSLLCVRKIFAGRIENECFVRCKAMKYKILVNCCRKHLHFFGIFAKILTYFLVALPNSAQKQNTSDK